MKLIIAGSRSITDPQTFLESFYESPFAANVDEIVTGDARGVDSLAKAYAERSLYHKYTEFEANWDEHPKAAGPIRNAEMAEYGDALLAVWNGESNGTRDMIDKALAEGLSVYVHVADA